MARVTTADCSALVKAVVAAHRDLEAPQDWWARALLEAKASISTPGRDGSVARIQIAGHEIGMTPTSIPVSTLMTGEQVVTDLHLALRQVLLLIATVAVGRRSPAGLTRVAAGMADIVAQFISGGNSGSALVRDGYSFIAPSWLALPTPQAVEVGPVIKYDPYSSLLYSLRNGSPAWDDAIGKAIKTAFDPAFSSFAVRHDAIVRVPEYKWHDVGSHADQWAPAFVPGPASDVLKRAGSLHTVEEVTWAGTLIDEGYPGGRLMRILQLPLILDQQHIGTRFRKEADGWWFLGPAVDYKLGGAVSEPLVDMLRTTEFGVLKLCYMQQRTSVRLPPGAIIPAMQMSPLSFARSIGKLELPPASRTVVVEWGGMLELMFNSLSPASIPADVSLLRRFGRMNSGWLSQEAIDWINQHG